MRVSLNWLREYVDFELSAQELADKLLLSGTAVESIEDIRPELEGVVVGQIQAIEPHPQADKLVLCRVMVDDGLLPIVCGAKNMKVGDKVAVARVGARLPGGLVIGRRDIRGVTSEGMMCSEIELGLGEEVSGILILDERAPLGKPVDKALGLRDTVLDLEITPNRPDCMSMIGIAREVAALAGSSLRLPEVRLVEGEEAVESVARVEVRDLELCPRYVARMIRGVRVGPSPLWMRRRLLAGGTRSINNLVDVTNYVLLETGQPLHAFDFERLIGGAIIVRRADGGEMVMTLDGTSRILDASTLVIADTAGPVAIAGVMGGAESEVTDETGAVLLESARFQPQSVQRASRGLGLISESSLRFERGVDPNGCGYAADRAIALMAELAGGEVLKGAIDIYPQPVAPRRLSLRPARAVEILGEDISREESSGILASLELKVEPGDDELSVTVPTFRGDLEREIDLIEEVARMYGYDRIAGTLPLTRGLGGGLTSRQKLQRKAAHTLVACGLREVMATGFVGPVLLDRLGLSEDSALRSAVRLRNPLGDEASLLRPGLVPGLIDLAVLNLDKGNRSLALFETARVFRPAGKPQPEERLNLAILLHGSREGKTWYGPQEEYDFFDLKGGVETLLDSLGLTGYSFRPAAHPLLHPGVAAEVAVEGETVGYLGQLHPFRARRLGFPSPVFLAEMDLDLLLAKAEAGLARIEAAVAAEGGPGEARPARGVVRELSRFPGVHFDVAVVVPEETAAAEIAAEIARAGGALLVEARLFDLYRGGQIPAGRKSLAFSLVYRAEDRTLTDEEAGEAHGVVVDALTSKGWEVRGR